MADDSQISMRRAHALQISRDFDRWAMGDACLVTRTSFFEDLNLKKKKKNFINKGKDTDI